VGVGLLREESVGGCRRGLEPGASQGKGEPPADARVTGRGQGYPPADARITGSRQCRELAGHVAQLARVQPPGGFQQDGLGVAEGFAAHLLGGTRDHPRVSLGDLTSGESLGGAGSSPRRMAWRPRSQAVLPYPLPGFAGYSPDFAGES